MALAQMLKSVASSIRPNLTTFLKYAAVELTPPKPTDIPAIARGIKDLIGAAKSGRWKHLTVKEAWLNTLVATEVTMWFFVGEVIGKRNLIGYDVECF